METNNTLSTNLFPEATHESFPLYKVQIQEIKEQHKSSFDTGWGILLILVGIIVLSMAVYTAYITDNSNGDTQFGLAWLTTGVIIVGLFCLFPGIGMWYDGSEIASKRALQTKEITDRPLDAKQLVKNLIESKKSLNEILPEGHAFTIDQLNQIVDALIDYSDNNNLGTRNNILCECLVTLSSMSPVESRAPVVQKIIDKLGIDFLCGTFKTDNKKKSILVGLLSINDKIKLLELSTENVRIFRAEVLDTLSQDQIASILHSINDKIGRGAYKGDTTNLDNLVHCASRATANEAVELAKLSVKYLGDENKRFYLSKLIEQDASEYALNFLNCFDESTQIKLVTEWFMKLSVKTVAQDPNAANVKWGKIADLSNALKEKIYQLIERSNNQDCIKELREVFYSSEFRNPEDISAFEKWFGHAEL